MGGTLYNVLHKRLKVTTLIFEELLLRLISFFNCRYGYYDQAGKLQIVNYSADPHGGFHAEGEHVPKPEYRR